jgi:hypothetical protein
MIMLTKGLERSTGRTYASSLLVIGRPKVLRVVAVAIDFMAVAVVHHQPDHFLVIIARYRSRRSNDGLADAAVRVVQHLDSGDEVLDFLR